MSTTEVSPVRIGKAAVAALGLLAISTGALESAVSPTLPLLQRELSLTPAEGALLSIAMLITGALLLPITGNLGDRFGGKRVMIRLMGVVVAGGLVSSLAPSLPVLLLGQVLQGAMLGAMPLSFILVRKYLSEGESSVAIGVVSGSFLAGGMLGTLIAGPIAEGLSRHWMFAIPTIGTAVATLLLHRLVPDDPPGRPDSRIDWPGLLLMSGILLTLMLVLAIVPEAGSQPIALGALVVLLGVLVAGWVAVERRSRAPMVDLRLLAQPAVWSSYAITFAVCLGTSLSMYLVPQLLAVTGDGYGFGASATDIGFYLLPGAVAAAVAGPVAGVAVRRFGSRPAVTVGVICMITALLALVFLHGEVWHLVVGKVLVALASGVCVTAVVVKTATAVSHGDTGTATSLLLVIRVVAFAAGAQVGGAFLTAGIPAGSDIPTESAFITGFVIGGAIAVLSLLTVRKLDKGVKE
ncbi:MFS transporter [Nonomuraea mesophila]|uniref:MFS transporter n=1 Tax=Nonomuraea mesophila TaxID=2530382 RepID=A0A4R5FSE1_9ACTN|nr:MFS transporter [Nonomuraea mesophila]TDE56154.1 MFS transporter [Nonomuraea mesophila]